MIDKATVITCNEESNNQSNNEDIHSEIETSVETVEKKELLSMTPLKESVTTHTSSIEHPAQSTPTVKIPSSVETTPTIIETTPTIIEGHPMCTLFLDSYPKLTQCYFY